MAKENKGGKHFPQTIITPTQLRWCGDRWLIAIKTLSALLSFRFVRI